MMPQHESASSVYSGVLHDAPAGAIAVWVTRNGVRRIGGVTSQMIEEGHWDADGHPTLSAALSQLDEYFNQKRKHFNLQLDFSGATKFQRRIFERLMGIPYGRIVSYGDIADEMGEPWRRAGGRPGRRGQPPSDRRSVPSRGPKRRQAGGLLRRAPSEGRSPSHRGCGCRRAPVGKPGLSRAAAASALGPAHLKPTPCGRAPSAGRRGLSPVAAF